MSYLLAAGIVLSATLILSAGGATDQGRSPTTATASTGVFNAYQAAHDPILQFLRPR